MMAQLNSSDLEWRKVLAELSDCDCDGDSDASREWPHPDYFAAANACGGSREDLEKLRRLSEDLESVVQLFPGPGSFVRVSGAPTQHLSILDGRCWREVLTNANLGRLIWTALLRYGQALQTSRMDSGSRRTGRIFSAVACVRLGELGEKHDAAPGAHDNAAELRQLRAKKYIPNFIQEILSTTPKIKH